MDSSRSVVHPDSWLFLRLPNELLKLIEIKANTIVDLGRFGTIPTNLLLGRPYYYTYEVLDRRDNEAHSRLRVVPPSELNADIVAEEAAASENRETPTASGGDTSSEPIDLVADDGTVLVKNNRLTIDDASRQALSQAEIEELKKSAGGKEIIERILANHAGLAEKTNFSKAKYTLRKTKKYLKRFMVLPMELGTLLKYVAEKEVGRVMEMREETLGFITAMSNAHYSGFDAELGKSMEAVDNEAETNQEKVGGGRWLVVDDVSGLLVASLAEKMGILHAPAKGKADDETTDEPETNSEALDVNQEHAHPVLDENQDTTMADDQENPGKPPVPRAVKPSFAADFPIPADSNTITLLHPAAQPNLSLLKHFGYDTNQPNAAHPLHRHLKPLSWLQLLHPSEDPTYNEPATLSEETLNAMKSGKRGTYHKKHRRWARCKAIVDETRQGNFDGLVVASYMDPATILPHLVPLVRGGGHVVIYSPTVKPLAEVVDLYSRERRTAYLQLLSNQPAEAIDKKDFPVDPRLLLAPTVQTTRVRDWQVLPGRSHPKMTSKGGAEGYVLSARRVLPLEGAVEARGNFGGQKRKKPAT
ncbi:hypothetical protein MBLNU230_g2139t2 [Neophaeotheca triangularis]